MMQTSARFQAGLLGVPRWVRSVEWSPDGAAWLPLKFHTGGITADATSQVRWSADLVASGATIGRFGINSYGCLLRVKLGMAFAPDDIEWVPLGKYRIDRVRNQYRTSRLEIKASSFEASIIDDEFYVPRIIPPGNGQAIIRSLIQETLPDASLTWRMSDTLSTTSIATSQSRWDVIDGARDAASISRALGGIVYCSRGGGFVAADTPSLQDLPVWTVDEGSVHIDSALELSRDDVYNVVVAMGESEEGDPIGPGVAEDNDPLSPTYSGRSPLAGGYGSVVYHYSSPLLRTLTQCRKAARSILAPLIGARQQIDFKSVFNPTLDAGDVFLVRNPGGLNPALVDALTFDLDNLTMEGRCRSTQGPVAGTVQQLPISQEAT